MSYSITAKRLRLPLGFALAIAYLVFARPTPGMLGIGAAVALAGVLIRAWASGHIMKNDRLATTGPYAHTRNPLYFGSFLIACGFALAAHWALLLVVALFFALIYVPTMQRERANVAQRFPEAYAEYCANVPAFFPRFSPWHRPDVEPGGFSRALYMKHGEWKAALGYAGALAVLALRMRGVV
ncbi:MAG: methyltransferase family protein [Gemmatimonadaceae bacterium]